MPPRILHDVAELQSLVGQELGTSSWREITQEAIRQFAELTGDRQWIHCNADRAARESPYQAAVAHGYFTLSLGPALAAEVFALEGSRLTLNYGANRVRFPAAVRAGARVRLHVKLKEVQARPDGAQATFLFEFEVQGEAKPACVAETVLRFVHEPSCAEPLQAVPPPAPQAAQPSGEVELSGGLVSLRSYHSDDVQPLYEAVRESTADLSQWMPWCHPDYSLREAAEWVAGRQAAWQRGEEYMFVIVSPASGQLLGGCGLNQLDPLRLRANLGYWVRTSQTGRGYATAAARCLARYGFERLKLERIEIVVAAGNTASQRVAEKAGATREGLARHRLRVHGTQLDALCYSLIPADLKKRCQEPCLLPRQRDA